MKLRLNHETKNRQRSHHDVDNRILALFNPRLNVDNRRLFNIRQWFGKNKKMESTKVKHIFIVGLFPNFGMWILIGILAFNFLKKIELSYEND